MTRPGHFPADPAVIWLTVGRTNGGLVVVPLRNGACRWWSLGLVAHKPAGTGGKGWIRTSDSRGMNPPLYQLSYLTGLRVPRRSP